MEQEKIRELIGRYYRGDIYRIEEIAKLHVWRVE